MKLITEYPNGTFKLKIYVSMGVVRFRYKQERIDAYNSILMKRVRNIDKEE